jgi:hypothetical protein
MTNGESTDAEVTEVLRSLREYVGIVRLDGLKTSQAWLLHWSGVLPETRDNTAEQTIIRTESWERYCRVLKLALQCREVVKLPIATLRLALPSKPVRREDLDGVRALGQGRKHRAIH